jgi:hypothetical protein
VSRGVGDSQPFLEFHDNEAAAWMKAWLGSRGSRTALLCKDKTTGIPPGADCEKTLYREVEESQGSPLMPLGPRRC